MRELTDEQFEELTSNSKMLGMIGMYVEDFCNGEDTVLKGVLRLLAAYHSMKSSELYAIIDDD